MDLKWEKHPLVKELEDAEPLWSALSPSGSPISSLFFPGMPRRRAVVKYDNGWGASVLETDDLSVKRRIEIMPLISEEGYFFDEWHLTRITMNEASVFLEGLSLLPKSWIYEIEALASGRMQDALNIASAMENDEARGMTLESEGEIWMELSLSSFFAESLSDINDYSLWERVGKALCSKGMKCGQRFFCQVAKMDASDEKKVSALKTFCSIDLLRSFVMSEKEAKLFCMLENSVLSKTAFETEKRKRAGL